LRVWFLEPGTRMNPNFNQAQAVPGVNDGRGIGMIESRHLTSVCDAAGLLAGSPHWTAADEAGLRAWMRAFLDWARTSRNGREEQAAKNNHGSWYDVQTAHLALYIGETNLAAQIIESAKTNRVARQFEPDGRQPLETAREDSFSYSRFNLQALFALAVLGEHAGVDLWRYESSRGASLRRGLDFLLPYAEHPDRPWPFRKGKDEKRSLTPILRRAAAAWPGDRYRQAWEADASTRNARELLLIPLN
jgi:hypothetical protein